VFDVSINVGAHESVSFNLTYQEILQRVHGVYKHTININTQQDKPVADMRVHVTINERRTITRLLVPAVGKKLSEKNNKDLTKLAAATNVEVKQTPLSDGGSNAEIDYAPKPADQGGDGVQLVTLYDVARTDDGGELQVVDGYFVHFFAPPDNVTVAPKRIVFVIDISGSMAGAKLQQTKDALHVILNELNSADIFNIVIFDDKVEMWQPNGQFQPVSKTKDAIAYVDKLSDRGGTDIDSAVHAALGQFTGTAIDSKYVDMIVFMTDGQATSGVTVQDSILSNMRRVARSLAPRNVTFHTIAFGNDADYDLLKMIAVASNGLARKVRAGPCMCVHVCRCTRTLMRIFKWKASTRRSAIPS
jgi:uncharacterized protein YegL